jgi:hypothetical protein
VIKVVKAADDAETLRRVVHSLNYSEVPLPFHALVFETVAFGAPTIYGGCSVDRSVFRKRLPDTRWFASAAGVVNPTDAAGVTLDLVYLTNAIAAVSLGAATFLGAGAVKATLGPFDVFGTGGVPAGETVPIIALRATKLVAGVATLSHWNIWIRFLPSKQ